MKLEPVTKTDKRNTAILKKLCDDVISASCNVIGIFPIYDQSEPIRKPDSRRMVCKTYIFINSNFLSYKSWKQN